MQSKIIAHRGLRTKYPEQTTLAIEKALEADIYGVEFDLEVTSDKKFVVIHQQTLLPKDGKLQLVHRDLARSWVNDTPQSLVCQFDAGTWFNPEFSNLRVPTIKDIKKLNWTGKTAFIELKDPNFWGDPDTDFENLIVETAMQELSRLQDINFVVLSFNEVILQKIKILNPNINVGLNVWIDRLEQMPELIQFCQHLKIGLIQLPDQTLCEQPELITAIHQAGILVGSFSVSPAYLEANYQNWTYLNYQPTLKKLIELSVDYIITDFPVESLEYLQNDIRHH